MFMDRKTQYCHNVSYSHLDLQTQQNPNKSSKKLFCGYQQTDSIFHVEMSKTQKNQHNTEEEQSLTDKNQLQDLLQSYSNQDSTIGKKIDKQINQTE